MGSSRSKYAVAAALGVVAVLATATVSGGRTLHTAAPTCGQALTASVTLAADMDCSAGGTNGLNVGANSITINLNGHTIRGNGGNIGISANGHTGVVIENGTIDDFGTGVLILGAASNSRVSGMRLVNNQSIGIDDESDGTILTGNVALNSVLDGIYVAPSSGVQVTKNLVEGNGTNGVLANGATGATVTGNVALNNTSAGIDAGGDSGTLSGNVANGNGTDGIDATSINRDALTPGLVVTGNRASFNAGYGISAEYTKDGGRNVVQQNGNAKQCLYVVCAAVSS